MNMNEWIPASAVGWRNAVINGAKVRVAPSPYDMPTAVRTLLDESGHQLRFEFQYIVPSELLVTRDLPTLGKASVQYEPASKRVTAVSIPYNPDARISDISKNFLAALEEFRRTIPDEQRSRPDISVKTVEADLRRAYEGLRERAAEVAGGCAV